MAVPARQDVRYDPHRYDGFGFEAFALNTVGLSDRAIAAELSRFVGVLYQRRVYAFREQVAAAVPTGVGSRVARPYM